MQRRRELKVPQAKSSSLRCSPAWAARRGVVSAPRFAVPLFPSRSFPIRCVRTSQLGSSTPHRSPGRMGRDPRGWLETHRGHSALFRIGRQSALPHRQRGEGHPLWTVP